jgi:hypothetical protein
MKLEEEKAKRILAVLSWSIENHPNVPTLTEKVRSEPVYDKHQFSGYFTGNDLRITDDENKLISLTLPSAEGAQTIYASYDQHRQKFRLERNTEGDVTSAKDDVNVKTYLVRVEDNEVELNSLDKYRITT